jgi:hypothetical protein
LYWESKNSEMGLKKKLRFVLDQLSALQVKTLVMPYHGGDDEGIIDQFKSSPAMTLPESLMEVIEEMCYTIIDGHYPGWSFSDGCAGYILFEVIARKVTIVHDDFTRDTNQAPTNIDVCERLGGPCHFEFF